MSQRNLEVLRSNLENELSTYRRRCENEIERFKRDLDAHDLVRRLRDNKQQIELEAQHVATLTKQHDDAIARIPARLRTKIREDVVQTIDDLLKQGIEASERRLKALRWD